MFKLVFVCMSLGWRKEAFWLEFRDCCYVSDLQYWRLLNNFIFPIFKEGLMLNYNGVSI